MTKQTTTLPPGIVKAFKSGKAAGAYNALAQMNCAPDTTAYSKGWIAYRSADYRTALQHLQPLQDHPLLGESSLVLISNSHMHVGQFTQAVETGQKSLQHYPHNASLYETTARSLLYMGKNAGALRIAQESFRRFPKDHAACYLYARALLHVGQIEQAGSVINGQSQDFFQRKESAFLKAQHAWLGGDKQMACRTLTGILTSQLYVPAVVLFMAAKNDLSPGLFNQFICPSKLQSLYEQAANIRQQPALALIADFPAIARDHLTCPAKNARLLPPASAGPT